jgi:hypothetical protein
MLTNKQFFSLIAVAVVTFMVMSIAMPETADAFFWHWKKKPTRGAPEIDPGSLSSAIALAMGGLAVLTDKLRRR